MHAGVLTRRGLVGRASLSAIVGGLVGALLGGPLSGSPFVESASAQTRDVYAGVPREIGGAVRPLPELPPVAGTAEHTRRSRVVARVDDVTVTIGEVEDRLAHATVAELTAFARPEGRHELVRTLLRLHLLAREATRRGAPSSTIVHRARRVEERVLTDLLESRLRALAAAEPNAAAEPVEAEPATAVPEERIGIVLRALSREAVATWASSSTDVSPDVALRNAGAVGDASQSAWAQRGATGLEPGLDDALFETARMGLASPPIALPDGRFGAVVVAGIRGGYEPEPDDPAIALDARATDDIQALDRSLRRAHLRTYAPERLDGIFFRLGPARGFASPEEANGELAPTTPATAEESAR